MISLTEQHPDWALGFLDETWWSRLARPAVHTWADASQPLRPVEPAVASSDPDPKALACYGLLVRWAARDEQVGLRFVDGRPLSTVTTPFLAWCCARLEDHWGAPVWTLIWDHASCHVSQQVRRWIHAHNQQVKHQGHGGRLLSCSLPVNSPWLTPSAPKWVHGTRALVEPDRLLSATELAHRACAYFGCPHDDHLIQQNVS